jgi:hypothetical protein
VTAQKTRSASASTKRLSARATRTTLLSALLLGAACGNELPDVPDGGPVPVVDASVGHDAATLLLCNGAAALCDRKFDEVAFPATHNAMSAQVEGFARSDQRYGIAKQLEDGIRALELDVWYRKASPDAPAELYLCHGGACSPGARKLSDALADISAFLDGHRNDVLTLLFEDHVPGADLLAALAAAGIREQTYDHTLDTPWPTLRELIAANTRVVTLYENQGGTTSPYPEGYQATWDYAWDTTWEFTQPSDFDDPEGGDCARYRGRQGENSLFILNHMLDTGDQAEEFAKTVNLEASLLTRARKCQRKSGHIPNFIKVDYYDVGDLFSSVNKLNGLE